VSDYQIEMLWTCSVCRHDANRGLKDRYCCNCGHKKDDSDIDRLPLDTSRAASLAGEEKRKATSGADWVCRYCEANQNQLNKCCGNCGGDREGTRLVSPAHAEQIGREVREDFEAAKRETEERGRALDAVYDLPPLHNGSIRGRTSALAWCGAAAALLLAGWFLVWLFTPRVVDAKVSQLYWQHDTLIERYQVYRREGWSPSIGAFGVHPAGMRHHHFDRVHVGSHREPYQESYACGQTCTTIAGSTSCRSNSNGTATCTTSPSRQSCSTKYCTRTAYRTVQDYKNVSREQMWFRWKVWDWGHNRTVTRSGFNHATTWPTESDLKAPLADGEKERSSRQASYKVTFTDQADGDSHFVRPNEAGFLSYHLGDRHQLKVNRLGSVEVLP
jgi:hypothetical protein